LSHFILACILLALSLFLVLTCCFRVDMGFNKDKKKKLADLLAKRRAAATGVGTSTPIAPPNSATSTPHQSNQPLLLIGKKGWWSSKQMTKTRAPTLSSKGKGWARSWRPLLLYQVGPQLSRTTPRAPPPYATLLFTKVGERVPLKAKRCLPPLRSSRCFSESSTTSKTRRCWRA